MIQCLLEGSGSENISNKNFLVFRESAFLSYIAEQSGLKFRVQKDFDQEYNFLSTFDLVHFCHEINENFLLKIIEQISRSQIS